MIGDRLSVLAVCGLLLMSCAATENPADGGPSTVPSPAPTSPAHTSEVTAATTVVTQTNGIDGPWAHEAELFFDALDDDHYDIAEFYTSSAVHENRVAELRLEGRDEIAAYDWPSALPEWSSEVGITATLFLGADRAATVRNFDPVQVPRVTDFRFYEMSEGRVAFEAVEMPLTELASWGQLTKDRAARVDALYTAYVMAWDSGDPRRVEAVYRPGAKRTDGLFGGTWAVGEEWINSLPAHLHVDVSNTYQAVIDALLPDDSTLTKAVFSAPTHDDPTSVQATFALSGARRCQLQLLAVWELDDYLIVSEEILYDIESLRSCAATYGLAPLPDGWWTGWELPPVVEEVTAQVTTPVGTVDVVNADRRQLQLLEWGLDRFERAGLTTPDIDVVAFPPTEWCAHQEGDYFGLTVFEDHEVRIDLCVLETEICTGPTCDTMRADARLGLLHELAHVWEHQQLDDDVRDAFLRERGLEVWWVPNPAGTPIDIDEGAEEAADIVAWGLMDEEVPMVRVDGTPEQLRAGFRLLTGVEPLLGS